MTLKFIYNTKYTKKEIQAELGGSIQASISIKNDVVKYMAVDPMVNPSFSQTKRSKYQLQEDQRIYLVGNAKQTIKNSSILIDFNDSFPTFIKSFHKTTRQTMWTYIGHYKYVKHSNNPDDIDFYGKGADLVYDKIVLVVFLQRVSKEQQEEYTEQNIKLAA